VHECHAGVHGGGGWWSGARWVHLLFSRTWWTHDHRICMGPLRKIRVCGSKLKMQRSKIRPPFSLILLQFCLLFFFCCDFW
jgi:hypothetical protein